MNKYSVRYITTSALIAALYAALTVLLWQFSSLAVQVRASEALCVLVLFTPAAVPGLFVGCLLANLLSGTWIDVVFGSLTTLAAAAWGRRIASRLMVGDGMPQKSALLLVPLPAVLLNSAVIPFILVYGYGAVSTETTHGALASLAMFSLSVLIGEMIACYGLGIPLARLLGRINSKKKIF